MYCIVLHIDCMYAFLCLCNVYAYIMYVLDLHVHIHAYNAIYVNNMHE